MDQSQEIIAQKAWTEDELRAAGFARYERRKQLVLARPLLESEAPREIVTPWDTLVAVAGTMICYRPDGPEARPSIDDFDHWPVEPAIFAQDYRPWDEPGPLDTPAQKQLLAAGCRPYYKHGGCWARRLKEPALVQSLESPDPVRYPAGAWLCIGSRGEPWGQDDAGFRSRYIVPDADLEG